MIFLGGEDEDDNEGGTGEFWGNDDDGGDDDDYQGNEGILDCPVGGENGCENLDPGSLGMGSDENRVRSSMLKSKNGPYDPFQVQYFLLHLLLLI